MSDYMHIQGIRAVVLNGYTIYISPRLCESITVDGKCRLHGKKTQPRVCKYFPMHQTDGTYLPVKHVCGYSFSKIKNKKYKVAKSDKEEK